MKRLSAILITLLLLSLTLCGFTACADEKPEPDAIPQPKGYITAVGKDLYTAEGEDGDYILLKGVNAGGWLLTEDWMCPTSLNTDLSGECGQYELYDALAEKIGEDKTTELFDLYRAKWWQTSDFDNVAALGFNCIRLPVGWRDLITEDGEFIEKGFDMVDWFVDNCVQRSLYVILDMHGAVGSQNGRHHSGDTRTGGDLFGNEANEALTTRLWTELARRYAEEKWVAGYDLLNEPEGVPGGKTNADKFRYFNDLYNAIRAVDPNHLIIIEACWDTYELPRPSDYGWENIAYEYHYYCWDNGNDFETEKSFLAQKVANEKLYNHGVPLLVGEFTFFDNLDTWAYGLELFEQQGWNWTVWTYKVCGESSGWGLYVGLPRNSENVVTPADDYASAKAKWERTATADSFTPNEGLINVIKRFTATDGEN